MYCPKCGKENPDSAQLCGFCSCVLTNTTVAASDDAKTSGLAITSLVLGILSIFTCFVTVIPAIIFGIIGLVKIEKSAGRLKGKGLAIAGIAVPAATLPVFFLLLGILMPALARVRAQARQIACMSNLKQLGAILAMYADDNDEKYPTADKWCDLLEPYYPDDRVFVCPSAGEGQYHYALNPYVDLKSPPDMVVLFESSAGWNQSGGPEILTVANHNGEGCSVLFNDLSVEFVRAEFINDLKWTVERNE
ncbi:MAG: DUF4190 domain-containing protein [Planctomycetota bacterium]|jgi:hypothetical protein